MIVTGDRGFKSAEVSARSGLAAGFGSAQFVWAELFLAAASPGWTLSSQAGAALVVRQGCAELDGAGGLGRQHPQQARDGAGRLGRVKTGRWAGRMSRLWNCSCSKTDLAPGRGQRTDL